MRSARERAPPVRRAARAAPRPPAMLLTTYTAGCPASHNPKLRSAWRSSRNRRWRLARGVQQRSGLAGWHRGPDVQVGVPEEVDERERLEPLCHREASIFEPRLAEHCRCQDERKSALEPSYFEQPTVVAGAHEGAARRISGARATGRGGSLRHAAPGRLPAARSWGLLLGGRARPRTRQCARKSPGKERRQDGHIVGNVAPALGEL